MNMYLQKMPKNIAKKVFPAFMLELELIILL